MSTSTSSSKHKPRPGRSDYKYWRTYETRWSNNDQYSHVNNAVYYHLIDAIVNTYLAQHCNCDPSSPPPSNHNVTDSRPIGLVVSSRCDFYSSLSFPDAVQLGLRVVHLGMSSVTYEVGFFSCEDEESGVLKAVGGYTHVFVDRISRRPVGSMGKELRAGLEALMSDGGFPVPGRLAKF